CGCFGPLRSSACLSPSSAQFRCCSPTAIPKVEDAAMSPPLIGAAGILFLFTLLFFRIPVWVALAFVGFVGFGVVSGWQGALPVAGTAPFDTASAYTLSVIPLFVLMGEV